jgi:stage II sporulation protein D
MGLGEAGNPAGTDIDAVALFIKERYFPEIPASSPVLFLEQQGILLRGGSNSREEVILRLLLRKGAFEWRDARLVSWDGEILRARVGQGIRDLRLDPAAPVFLRVGETRVPVSEGAWMGGERLQLRILDETVEALVYEPLPGATTSADRYSPLAHWETRLTREELNTAVAPLGIGELQDVVVLDRGASGRVVEAELRGTLRTTAITGPRLRTLFGLRDSLVYIEEARNARRELIGMTFFGGGWGHGVGMCQVGAFGMAMDGASAEDILKTYYTGIDIEKVY